MTQKQETTNTIDNGLLARAFRCWTFATKNVDKQTPEPNGKILLLACDDCECQEEHKMTDGNWVCMWCGYAKTSAVRAKHTPVISGRLQ